MGREKVRQKEELGAKSGAKSVTKWGVESRVIKVGQREKWWEKSGAQSQA